MFSDSSTTRINFMILLSFFFREKNPHQCRFVDIWFRTRIVFSCIFLFAKSSADGYHDNQNEKRRDFFFLKNFQFDASMEWAKQEGWESENKNNQKQIKIDWMPNNQHIIFNRPLLLFRISHNQVHFFCVWRFHANEIRLSFVDCLSCVQFGQFMNH